MADSDPISEATPNKRRKIDYGTQKGWDSQDDDGDDLFEEEFQTVPTQALTNGTTAHKRKPLGYSAQAFHSDIDAMTMKSSQVQPPHVTQPTQPLQTQRPAEILVDRSSPPTSPPQKFPQPLSRAPFAKPRSGLLASSLAPQGTTFRLPAGVQQKKQIITLDDSDEEPDPPVQLDSDDETQGLSSNIKPTNFKRGGRGLDSTPNRSDNVVRESPTATRGGGTTFASLMSGFVHKPMGDDMANAYGGQIRRPRPQQTQTQTQRGQAQAVPRPVQYHTLDDVQDYLIRENIKRIQVVLPLHSVQTCYDALVKKRNNYTDAIDWLNEQEAENDEDELGSMSPILKRGVANPVFQRAKEASQTAQARQTAKQELKAPARSIFEKYGSTQAARRQTQPTQESQNSDDDVKPKRRLLGGRKNRSPSPESSPQQRAPPQRLKQNRKVITIDDDEDEEEEAQDTDSGVDKDSEDDDDDVETVSSSFDDKLLKLLNESTVRDLSGLCAMPEDQVKFVLEHRPFSSLNEVRVLSQVTETKSGKKSRSRPVGDKLVEVCSEMLTGYDAVDELVNECAKIAEPIQQALKSWGLGGEGDGELHIMKLDDAQDSGIGTPASSCAPDDTPKPKTSTGKTKSKFLGQPESMDSELTMKDYQLVGLNWLNLLWSKKISCILADDMGLGKTCQVISFLAHLQEQEVDGVHLVIVPGSTLENWLREFARFAPELNVVPYYGGQNERPELQLKIEEDFSTIDVIVTTYDMTKSKMDNKFLRELGPAVCVYDEAHALRNPKSDRYTQLTKIKADFKILLTGTPLQNNLQELIAILAFIMPDMFQGKREELDYIFQHKATTKDTDHAALLSAERIARARTMMTPFILRRKKAQVLDLPAKHSRVDWCGMTDTQADYYTGLLEDAQRFFAEKAVSKTKARAAKESSNIIMALRKAAVHPLLARRIYTDKKLDKITAELSKHPEFADNSTQKIRAYIDGTASPSLKGGDYGLHVFCAARPYLQKFALKNQEWMDSGKVQAFKELVTKYKANGDRLLVFSQFTTVMDILEAVLETLEIKFFRLDGQTAMNTRQDMLDEFANDTSIPVFMLSTKAGGAGINLACANKVIIFDSGFNPQDDIQAENRAHRVGQTREVEVVRLVTKGTIEEQIHALGESKLALDERVAGEGASPADEKEAEKSGQQMVEKMFVEKMHGQEKKEEAQKEEPSDQQEKAASRSNGDLRDMFKKGMEKAGVSVASKQAQF